MPKIELHAHIGGCIRRETFEYLAKSKNIDTSCLNLVGPNLD